MSIKEIFLKVRHFFVGKFSTQSMEIQKKANMLFLVIIMSLPAIIFISILLFFMKSYYLAFIMGVNLFLYSMVLVLLRIKTYITASNTYILSTFILANIIIFFLPYAINYIITLYAALMSIMFISSSLLGNRIYQLIIMLVLSIMMLGVLLILNLPELNNKSFLPFGLSFIIICLTNGLVLLIKNITSELMMIAEKEARINKDRYLKLENLVVELQKGKNIGNDIINFTKKTIEVINNLKVNFTDIKNQSIQLNEKLKIVVNSNKEILNSTINGKIEIESQNAAVYESSGAVEEITNLIMNIARVTGEKNKAVKALTDITKTVEEKMTTANQANITVKQSTSNIKDINEVIYSIAQQTDILAMNAAIEAAHAGSTGKGFTIVADEIRKLSENTDINSKNIKKTVNRIIKDIEISSDANNEASVLFTSIQKEIQAFLDMLQEITNGMTELSRGSDKIMQAIVNLRENTSKTTQSITTIEDMIKESRAVITNIESFSNKIAESMENAVSEFVKILTNTENLNTIGMENINQINVLNEKLTAITGS
ncbi:MAG: hypothetical protein JXB88_22305 [Spirochaetales bacterium]|nr:hypothetical protein [Spirochaetales bacterium]